MDLNHRHRAYETPALPLSYTATGTSIYDSTRAKSTVIASILSAMALKEKASGVECPSCHRMVDERALQLCTICRSVFCQRCAVAGYGREFCSERCREFFFHGDDDELPEED